MIIVICCVGSEYEESYILQSLQEFLSSIYDLILCKFSFIFVGVDKRGVSVCPFTQGIKYSVKVFKCVTQSCSWHSLLLKYFYLHPGMVIHFYSPSTQYTETRRLWVWGQPHGKTPISKTIHSNRTWQENFCRGCQYSSPGWALGCLLLGRIIWVLSLEPTLHGRKKTDSCRLSSDSHMPFWLRCT